MSYGIWDVGRKKWMPDPLLGHMSRRPESFKTRGEAERTADREWRKLNPDVKFEVRPLPSTEESRRTRKPSAHKAGADYAHEQLAGSYFQDWVWEQMVEAERMRQADPNSVIDASTPAGARKVAKNMLQQLKWDTKRALKESKEFFEGFDEVLQSQSSIDWLADMILDFDKEARGPAGKEAREARRGSRGKKTFEAYALEVEQALVASGVRPGQAAVWTSNHGAFIDKELKDGASANDTAERILESERESSIPYGRESRRPVAPYYSRKR